MRCHEHVSHSRGELRAYRDDIVLSPLRVDATPYCPPSKLAWNVEWLAWGQVRYAHMLGAEGDEVVHWWRVIPLYVRT